MMTSRATQEYNGKGPISLVYVSKPLITLITLIGQLGERTDFDISSAFASDLKGHFHAT